MRSDQETQDMPVTGAIVPVPVLVQNRVAVESEDFLIEGYGFTISHTVGDTNPTQPLLPEDVMRTRAVVFANAATAFIGTPQEMRSVSATMATADPGPGTRLPAGAIGTEIYAQNEIWVGFTAVCQISVWVERKVPRGKP